MTGSRITITEDNRDDFIERACLHIVYLDECMALTLAEYVAHQEPSMRKRRWFGLQEPYWTAEESPTWQTVDDYRVSLSEWNWRTGADKVATFAELKAQYDVVLRALIHGDVVELSEGMYNQLTNERQPKSWYREI